MIVKEVLFVKCAVPGTQALNEEYMGDGKDDRRSPPLLIHHPPWGYLVEPEERQCPGCWSWP